MAEEEVILLDSPISPFTMRIRIALAEKAISYISIEEDFSDKSTLLKNANPIYKKVPVLIHNGKYVCESLIILEYIDEIWKDYRKSSLLLLPSDPLERAHARFWANFVDDKFIKYGKGVCMNEGEVQRVAKKELTECFKLLEMELGNKAYFSDKVFGFIDLAVISFYSWFNAYEKYGNFSIIEEYPKLIAWTNRCLEKESVSKSLADPQIILRFVSDLLEKKKKKKPIWKNNFKIQK